MKRTEIDYNKYLNQTFGYLKILKIIKNPGGGASLEVECKCGKIKIKPASRIVTGHCKSCGCRDFPRLNKRKPLHEKVLPNITYGKLTTISKCIKKWKTDVRSVTWWLCKCNCGELKEIRETHIKYGSMVTCGICSKRGKTHPRWNGYEEISTRYFRYIKMGAKKRDFSFNVTIEQMWNKFIEQDKKCALSGLPLTFPTTSGNLSDGTASLDRIDSNLGYELSNIQWVHKVLNLIKMDLPQEEFFYYCNLVTEYQKQKSPKDIIP